MVSPYEGKNWQLIVAGILLVLFAAVCLFFPGITLGSIAFMLGMAFIFWNRNPSYGHRIFHGSRNVCHFDWSVCSYARCVAHCFGY